MISCSAGFKRELANDNRKYQILINMTLADNTSLTITNKDLAFGTFKIEDATSETGKFTVGALVTGKCSFSLMNNGRYTDTLTGDGTTTSFALSHYKVKILGVIIDEQYSEIGYSLDRGNIVFDTAPANGAVIKVTYFYEDAFSDYDFGYATFTAQIGLDVEGTVEYLMLGRFTVCEPTYTDSNVSLVCYDNGYKLAKAFNFTGITFPATLYTLLMAVQSQTGVNVVTSPNLPLLNSYQIAAKPNQDMTCADMVACIAQINGRFAKINTLGQMYFAWYDLTGASSLMTSYDGGTFMYDGHTADGRPEAQLDGGTFAYNDGDTADGGSFTDRSGFHLITGLASHNIFTDDVVISGVTVTEEFDENENHKRGTSTVGTDGYVIAISGNPLIQEGQAATVANNIYTVIGGMTFRPFSVSCLNDPTIEAGDAAVIIDRKNNPQVGFISTRAFTVGDYESLTCDAEEPMRNAMKDLSTIAKAMSAAKSQISKLETYQALVQQQIEADRAAFSALVTNSLGGHSTRIQQQDGSYIYYFHDADVLANSTTVWRFSADTFAWTNAYTGDDSTTSWQTGFDSSGNAVLHNLSADWIKAGTLSADYVLGGSITVGGTTGVNGTIDVKDASGNLKIRLNKDGITLTNGTTISYNNISDTPTIPTNTNQLTNGAGFINSTQATTITENTVTTAYVNALNITAGSVAAENITGTTISGKTISGGTINGANIIGGSITAGTLRTRYDYTVDMCLDFDYHNITGKRNVGGVFSTVLGIEFGTPESYKNMRITVPNDGDIEMGMSLSGYGDTIDEGIAINHTAGIAIATTAKPISLGVFDNTSERNILYVFKIGTTGVQMYSAGAMRQAYDSNNALVTVNKLKIANGIITGVA